MNRLPQAKRVQVVKALVEGNSIQATVRMTGVAKNTVAKLSVELGEACSEYQDKALHDLTCRRIECDEIWSFCHTRSAYFGAIRSGVSDESDHRFRWIPISHFGAIRSP